MHIGAAADHGDPSGGDVVGQQALGDDLGAAQGALLALAELRLPRQLERDRLGGDHVLQRTALLAREDRGVDLLGDGGVVGQDHATTRTAQGLVSRGGGDVCVRDRVGVQTRGHQSGEVGHVHHQVGTDEIRDPAELGEVELAGVRRPAGHDQLRAVLERELLHLSHVDEHVLFAHLVWHDAVEAAGEVDPHAVSEVAAVCQGETEDGVARLQQCEHGGGVGLRARVRLHVGELGAEQTLDPVDGQLLDDIDVLAAAVVTPARVALGVLVGQHRTLSLHHSLRGEVLRRDHLQRLLLATQLRADGRLHLRIGFRQRACQHINHVLLLQHRLVCY